MGNMGEKRRNKMAKIVGKVKRRTECCYCWNEVEYEKDDICSYDLHGCPEVEEEHGLTVWTIPYDVIICPNCGNVIRITDERRFVYQAIDTYFTNNDALVDAIEMRFGLNKLYDYQKNKIKFPKNPEKWTEFIV